MRFCTKIVILLLTICSTMLLTIYLYRPNDATLREPSYWTAKTGSPNAPVLVLVMVFSCPVIEMMKSSVRSVSYSTTVDGIHSPLFNFLLQYLEKRIVTLCTSMTGRLLPTIMFTRYFSCL